MDNTERRGGGFQAPHLYEFAERTKYLSMFTERQEKAGVPTGITLVTYNRVGEGRLKPRTTKGKLALNVFEGGKRNRLSDEQAVKFLVETKESLLSQIQWLDRKTFFVVYAGGEAGGVKFRTAIDLVKEISTFASVMGKQDRATFYVLTCGCDLPEKAEVVKPLCDKDLVRCLIVNRNGGCGGFDELQAIADGVLKAIPDAGDFGTPRGLVS